MPLQYRVSFMQFVFHNKQHFRWSSIFMKLSLCLDLFSVLSSTTGGSVTGSDCIENEFRLFSFWPLSRGGKDKYILQQMSQAELTPFQQLDELLLALVYG